MHSSFSALAISCMMILGQVEAEQIEIPKDLKIVAHFYSGGLDAETWEATITADGRGTLVYKGVTEPEIRKSFALKEKDLRDLFTGICDIKFMTLKENYEGGMEDGWGFVLKVTQDGKTHSIRVWGIDNHEDGDEKVIKKPVSLWEKILRKVPSPNGDGELELIGSKR